MTYMSSGHDRRTLHESRTYSMNIAYDHVAWLVAASHVFWPWAMLRDQRASNIRFALDVTKCPLIKNMLYDHRICLMMIESSCDRMTCLMIVAHVLWS